MTTIPISSHNNDDDDDSNLQQQPKRQIPSAQRQRALGTPDKFVLGDRSGLNRNDNFQSQRYTTANLHRVNDADYDVGLLKHLSNDFAQLLNRTDISDCLLNVKGTYMAVHRCVLAARSNTFAAMISGNISRLDTTTRTQLETLTDKDKLIISIDKTDPEIMKQVVIFLYTAKCELNERNAYGLLDAAGRYDIKSLKVHTGRFLMNHINTNNVLMLIKAAYKYDNVLVKQQCINYFIDHAKEIMDISELWKAFAEEYPFIVAELLYWSVNKDEFRKKIPRAESYSQW